MAPKINPKPQLKRETRMVKRVTVKAEVAVLLQNRVMKLMNRSTGFVRARACPKTSINIICTANSSSVVFQRPLYQNPTSSNPREPESKSESVKENARRKVTMVMRIAMVKGVGKNDLNTFSIPLSNFIEVDSKLFLVRK